MIGHFVLIKISPFLVGILKSLGHNRNKKNIILLFLANELLVSVLSSRSYFKIAFFQGELIWCHRKDLRFLFPLGHESYDNDFDHN